MAKIRIRYLTRRPGKGGRNRYFWQPGKALKKAGWKLTRLSDNEDEAIAQAQAINRQVDEWRAGDLKAPTTARPGSVEAVIEHYLNSTDFNELAEKTKKDYRFYLERTRMLMGDKPAAAITSKMVQDIYETLRGQSARKAMYLVQVIRLLFSYAERQSLIPPNTNPARKPRLRYKAVKGKIWSPAAVKAFVKQADKYDHFGIGTAVMLNEWIGQRKNDILTLRMDALQGGVIHLTQSKTGADVDGLDLTVIPAVQARVIEQIKQNKLRKTGSLYLIQQHSGKPYSGDWFTHCVRTIARAGKKDCPDLDGMTFMHLRHTAVTRLAESGAEIPEIAAVTGHSMKAVQDIVDRYSVRTRKMARNALIKRATAERS